jgi:beta-lactamase regulating signal transducer with metallopeptidase domain
MTAWSQSPFLQALGWAMLNSFWQMALIFASFSALQHVVRLSSQRKYVLAIGSMGIGLFWFTCTFFAFFSKGADGTILAKHPFAPTSQTWNILLSSASLAYLVLLLVPTYRLFKNWRYIVHLKRRGLQKTAMEYRLFVKKIAQHLGIRHTVHVYLSQLVQSPVTIGYFKPIILLPIAAINSLSPQQVEAVLLHELSHIKRYDYLINFIITLLQTLFYFNPFVKKFVSVIEFEREKCCDELVMQFQYDKISYASALLLLEKNLVASETLAVGAAGKKHLLSRIEKIVGLEKRTPLTFQQFAGLLTSFIAVLFINSLFFVDKEVLKPSKSTHTFTTFENPLYQFDAPVAETFSKHQLQGEQVRVGKPSQKSTILFKKETLITVFPEPQPDNTIIPVAYDASEELVTPEEKVQISQTLEATKKVLTKTKWKEVEASIGDGMTTAEKKVAKHQYLNELDKVDWKKLEAHLKSDYENLDWTEIELKLNSALADLKLDSMQNTYNQILSQLRITEAHSQNGCKKAVLPVPDISVQQVNALKVELKARIDSIQVVRERKVINF